MKRALFDVNVLLDILLDRRPHVEASAAAFAAVESDLAAGLLAAHAVTTIYYLIRREMTAAKARRVISAVLAPLEVAAVDGGVVQEALDLSWPDFEDAVTAAAARKARCDYIITRDPKGFLGSTVRVLTPEAFVTILKQ
jgi:predicted nucleic acid-binding protein